MLHTRTCWIFDMDGTLTESLHDFPAISRALGLPENRPILEALDELPKDEAARRHAQLHDIELEIARQATPQPGAHQLLSDLKAQNRHIGILTRNSKAIAHETLLACGLDTYFRPSDVLGRSCCPPKPQPAGILRLLHQWQSPPQSAVMIGDHKFDLIAGRQAQALSVYLDPAGQFPFQQHADYQVTSLDELARLARHDEEVEADRKEA